MPIFVAPFGGDCALHAQGWHAVARATARTGAAAIVPAEPGAGLASIATAVAPQRLLACQILLRGSANELLDRVTDAARAGYHFVCVTDAPITGWRERMMRHRAELARHASQIPTPRRAETLTESLRTDRWTWARLAELSAEFEIPWVYKGILTPQDAASAIDAGAAAVYVSNIGGRQLDALPATLDQLPEIARAVDRVVRVFVDGGVRRGSDVAKALALGADLVGLGRTMAMALAADGEEGAFEPFNFCRPSWSRR
jgi:isopentenyl diphosphate isomerase/L-lactate dehydrogenase-like FMN-dependent dehydrogenase